MALCRLGGPGDPGNNVSGMPSGVDPANIRASGWAFCWCWWWSFKISGHGGGEGEGRKREGRREEEEGMEEGREEEESQEPPMGQSWSQIGAGRVDCGPPE